MYACSLGHVFLPRLERTRTITCQQDARRWSARVGSCYPFEYLRQYGNATILALLERKYPAAQRDREGGGGRRTTTVRLQQHTVDAALPPPPPPSVLLATSWLEEVVLPVLGVGAAVVLALFAAIVLLLVRRHLQFEREGHPIDEDR